MASMMVKMTRGDHCRLYLDANEACQAHFTYSHLPAAAVGPTLPLTPKTPETVDWDRNSGIIVTSATGKTSATVLAPSVAPERPNDHPPINRNAKRLRTAEEDDNPNPVTAKPKLRLILKLDVGENTCKLEESSLCTLLDSLETLAPPEFLSTARTCLLGSAEFSDLVGKICRRLPQMWNITTNLLSSSYLSAAVVAFLEQFAIFVRSTGVDESFLVSCSTSILIALTSDSTPSPSVCLSLVNLIAIAMSKSTVVYDHVIEELLHLPTDTIKPPRIPVGQSLVSWMTWLHLLLVYQSLGSLEPPEAATVSPSQLFRPLAHLSMVSEQALSLRRLNMLLMISEDVISMARCGEFHCARLLLRYLYGIVLKLSVLKLKSEHRLKLLEIGGSMTAVLRPLELSVDVALDDPLNKDQEPEGTTGLAREQGVEPEHVLSRLSNLLMGDKEESSASALEKHADTGPSSDKYVAVLVSTLSDPAPLVRVRAVKELTKVICHSDPLAKNKNFCITMERLVKDISPGVRDSALEFLAQFPPSHELHTAFTQVLPLCLHDDSLSVRKRAFKLAAKVMRETPHAEATVIVKAIMIGDSANRSDPSRSHCLDALVNAWIFPLVQSYRHSKEMQELQVSRTVIEEFACEIMRLLAIGRVSGENIRHFFSQITSGDQGATFQEVCQCAVSWLLERLISCASSDAENIQSSTLAALVAVFSSEALVSEAQFRIICEFLKADNHSIVENTLQLLNIVLANESPLRLKKVSHLVPTLFKLSFRGNEIIIRLALDCIFKMSLSSSSLKMQLYRTYEKITGLLRGREENPDSANMCRYLLAAAYIARLGHELGFKWDLSLESIADLIDKSWGLNHSLDNFCCVAAIEIVLADPVASIRRPLCDILLSCLNSPVISLRMVVIKGFTSLLKKSSDMEAVPSFQLLSAPTTDISSTLCPLFQFYIEYLVDSGLCGDAHVVESSLYLIAEVLRRGLCHPRSTLPFLLCVCQCPWGHLAQFATGICAEVCESYMSFIPSSFGSLFKMSFRLQQCLKESSRVSGYVVDENGATQSLLRPVYDICKTKSCRRELVRNLLQEMLTEELDYVIYLCEVLLELPLTSLEEVDLIGRRLTDLASIPPPEDVAPNREVLVCRLVVNRARNHFYHIYRLAHE